MSTRSGVDQWRDFVGELANAPDVIARLLALHTATDAGLCATCTRPGRGTAHVAWPCTMWNLADAASHERPV